MTDPSYTIPADLRPWVKRTAPKLTVDDWAFLDALVASEHGALVGGDAFGHDYSCDNAAAKRLDTLGAVDYQGFSEHWQWALNEGARALLAFRDEVANLPGAFVRSDGRVNCDLCCTGDRCDEPRHYYRRNCPMCRGTGALPDVIAERARVLREDGGR